MNMVNEHGIKGRLQIIEISYQENAIWGVANLKTAIGTLVHSHQKIRQSIHIYGALWTPPEFEFFTYA